MDIITATRDRSQLPSGSGDKERDEASFYLSSLGVRSSGTSNINFSINVHWSCEGTMSWYLVVC